MKIHQFCVVLILRKMSSGWRRAGSSVKEMPSKVGCDDDNDDTQRRAAKRCHFIIIVGWEEKTENVYTV